MDEWTVAFDLMEDGISYLFVDWVGPAAGLFIFMIFTIALVSNRTLAGAIPLRMSIRWPALAKFYRGYIIVFSGMGFLFSGLFIVSMFWSIIKDHLELRQAYLKRTYTVVEGRAQNYRSIPELGYYKEEFTVNGTRFALSARHESSGPIREGIYVRIWHVDGDIIRLEIRK